MEEKYYKMSAEQVFAALGTSEKGLSLDEVKERAEKYGVNALPKDKKRPFILKFLDQFKNIMIIILLIAAVISAFTHEIASSVIIFLVVFLNSLLGVIQEGRAEKALDALQKMSSPHAKVRRNGTVEDVESKELVPGDIVLLEAGSTVPADIRLTVCAALKAEEAALTGESVPSEKSLDVITSENAPLGDRKNMVFSSGSIVYGRGEGVVTAIGTFTEVGKIATHLSEETRSLTPLQIKLNSLSKTITKGVLIIASVIFGVGLLYGRELSDMFMTAISLAVSAIPEGLAAVVTILLAIGVQRMAKQNAIIRKLSAVETLGSTEIICSDKTGTLTQNKMTVKQVYYGQKLFTDSEFISKEIQPFILALALCNDVDEDASGKLLGDPTETALVAFANNKNQFKTTLVQEYPRASEIPFDSERKLMSTVHRYKKKFLMLTKGAPDILLSRCTDFLTEDGRVQPLTPKIKAEIVKNIENLSKQALRVLSYAYVLFDKLPEKMSLDLENKLVFSGLTGMIDPPREEVFEAVKTCKAAGMRPVMITGDHKDTAVAIAKQLGILLYEDEAITGRELDLMTQDELEKNIAKYSVFARVAPDHKVKIVKAWQKAGKVVAMTGDGVNDAPALNIANIGIGMGITGTDVSKSVSSMVLTDDNFATIVLAVKEGRTIYANIQRAVQYLLSTNLGEVVFLFLGTLLNKELLLPIHLLWINLVTDSLPAIALGFEPAEKDIMGHPPRKANASFLSDGVGSSVLIMGITVGLITLATYFVGDVLYKDHGVAMTLSFLSIGAWSMFQSLNLKSSKVSLFKTGIRSNKTLLLAILVSSLLHVSVMLIPGIRGIFQLSVLSPVQWLIGIGIAALVIPVYEIVKLVRRRKDKKF